MYWDLPGARMDFSARTDFVAEANTGSAEARETCTDFVAGCTDFAGAQEAYKGSAADIVDTDSANSIPAGRADGTADDIAGCTRTPVAAARTFPTGRFVPAAF